MKNLACILASLAVLTGCHSFEVELEVDPSDLCIDDFLVIVDGVEQVLPATQILEVDAASDADIQLIGRIGGNHWMLGTLSPSTKPLTPIAAPLVRPPNVVVVPRSGTATIEPTEGLGDIVKRGEVQSCPTNNNVSVDEVSGQLTVSDPTHVTGFVGCGVSQPLDTEFVEVTTEHFPLMPRCRVHRMFSFYDDNGGSNILAGRCETGSSTPKVCDAMVWQLRDNLQDAATSEACNTTDDYCKTMTVASARRRVTFRVNDRFLDISFQPNGPPIERCEPVPPSWTGPAIAASSGSDNSLWLEGGRVFVAPDNQEVALDNVAGVARDLVWTDDGTLFRVRGFDNFEVLEPNLAIQGCDGLARPVTMTGFRPAEGANPGLRLAPVTVTMAFCASTGQLYEWVNAAWRTLGAELGSGVVGVVWTYDEIQTVLNSEPDIESGRRDTLWAQDKAGTIHVGRLAGDDIHRFSWTRVSGVDVDVQGQTVTLDVNGVMAPSGRGNGIIVSAAERTGVVRFELSWADCSSP